MLWVALEGSQKLYRTRTLPASTGFLLAWAVFCLVFFSISRSKLPGYVLPAFPAMALLLSHRAATAAPKKSFALPLIIFGCILVVALFPIKIMLAETSRVRPDIVSSYSAISLALGAASLFAGIPGLLRLAGVRRLAMIAVAVFFATLPMLFADMLVSHLFLSEPSARSIARQIIFQRVPPERLVTESVGRSYAYGLNFYVHRELPVWSGAIGEETYLLSGFRRCDRLQLLGIACTMVTLGPAENGWFLLRLTPDRSADGLAGGGKPR